MFLDLFKPRSLDALAVRYRTDKSHLTHNFAQFYDRYFTELRDRPIKLLEIGIGRGASIRMWKRYFRRAQLFAVESEPRRGKYRFLGAKVYVGRQEDRTFLRSMMDQIGPVDIIIDDGSHRVDDQQITLGCLFPYLKPGGHYIIEDIHTSFPGQAVDSGLAPDLSNSTYRFLLDFKATGNFASRNLSSAELEYLDRHVSLCETYAYQDERRHLTSLLKKSAANQA
jgi:hypothetical protein